MMRAGMDELAGEMRRLSKLTGNCGRVVSRFLARHVDQLELELRFDVPRSWRLLDLACGVAAMRSFLCGSGERGAEARSYLVEVEVFPWQSTMAVSYVMKLREMPEGVAARQQLLRECSEAMDMVSGMHESWMCEEAPTSGRAWFLGEDGQINEETMGVFDAVVRGVYVGIESLDRALLALANVLNNQVASVVGSGVDLTVKPAEGDLLSSVAA